MRHTDFHIGLEFFAAGGFRWQCTDIGTRTIAAIRIDQESRDWRAGPPYVIDEIVFDEHEMEHCHLTLLDAAHASSARQKETGHPGYPSAVVQIMLEARHEDFERRYPHQGVLRFDRVRADGEILHPYAGRHAKSGWTILLYLPFLGSFKQMPEADFLSLRIASAADIRARADRKTTPS